MPGASFASRRAQAPTATRSETANVRQVLQHGLGIRDFLTMSPLCALIRKWQASFHPGHHGREA
jgi:hypothetical protein